MAKFAKVTVTDIDLGWGNWMRESAILNGSYVDIGIFPDAGNHPGGSRLFSRQGGQEPHMAQIGFWNEFGTEHMPERSFIRSTMSEKERELRDKIISDLNRLNIRRMKASALLKKVGLFVKGSIKDKINLLRSPPNAKRTVEIKGFNDPLVDTRAMMNSIKFQTFFSAAGIFFNPNKAFQKLSGTF